MKVLKNSIILMFTVAFSACVKLSEKPLTFITPVQFFKTVDDANASCLGLYPDMYNESETWVETPRGVEGNDNDGRMQQENYLEPDANSGDHMSNLWASYYRLIRKCNTTIEGLEGSPLSAEQKNSYLGEAKAMRAFAYLRLVKNWGDVPVRLTVATSNDNSYPLTALKDVYTVIFKDLNDALYVNHIWDAGAKPGRLDRAGVRILMADAAITIGQSANSYKNGGPDAAALKPYGDAYGSEIEQYFRMAYQQLDTLVNHSAYYKLFPVESKGWINMFGRDSSGTDLVANSSVIIRTSTIPSKYPGGVPTVPGVSDWLPSDLGQLIVPTYEYVASFNKDDIRRNKGFLWYYRNINTLGNETEYHLPFREFGNEPFGDLGFPSVHATAGFADYPNSDLDQQWNTKTVEFTTGSGSNLHHTTIVYDPGYPVPMCAKFYDKSDISGAAAISTPLYRVAEAYLMYAEASVFLKGVTQDAVDKLNAIHSRAFPNPKDHQFKVSDFTGISDFNTALINEYLWEFGFENKGIFVLIRFGKLQERIKKVVDTYNPVFSPGHTQPVLGVESAIGDLYMTQYSVRQRKVRGLDQYWLPYPYAGEAALNTSFNGLKRMNYN